MPGKLRKVHGEYRPYVEFKAGADRFLARSEEDRRQEHYNQLAALLFFAFSAEAFVNHVGGKKYPKWWKLVDRSPFVPKLKLLCSHLDVDLDLGKRPFSSIQECMERRNKLVHSKYDSFEYVVEVAADDKSGHHLFEQTERDRIAEPEFLRQLSEDLDNVIYLILAAARLENENPESLASSSSESVPP